MSAQFEMPDVVKPIRATTRRLLPLDRRAPAPRRIAVFCPRSLGDLLCAIPAMRALRTAAPLADVTLIGLASARNFVERYGEYLDDLLVFPETVNGSSDPDALACFQRAGRGRRFDLLVAMAEVGPGDQWLQQLHALTAPSLRLQTGNEIHRQMKLVESLGAPYTGTQLEFPLCAGDRAEASALLARHRLVPGGYVCVHAGARLISRRWPLAQFVSVIRALLRDGWPVLLTGTADERLLTRSLLREGQEPGLLAGIADCAGATSLGGLAALVAQARLLIANDTCVSHLAAALGTPSVIVSFDKDWQRWAPLDTRRHRVLPADFGLSAESVIDTARIVLHEEARCAA